MTLSLVGAYKEEQQKREREQRKKDDKKAEANRYTELVPNDECRAFVAAVDSVFREGFEKTFGKFFSPMDSIVSKQDVLDLIGQFDLYFMRAFQIPFNVHRKSSAGRVAGQMHLQQQTSTIFPLASPATFLY
mmetsp:Transcript_22147/g.32957  ORF Transcript_22147/g.32957 Transcript_22147/m.32957 type:complete len:132 (+) Transcript_22147:326-721(+)